MKKVTLYLLVLCVFLLSACASQAGPAATEAAPPSAQNSSAAQAGPSLRVSPEEQMMQPLNALLAALYGGTVYPAEGKVSNGCAFDYLFHMANLYHAGEAKQYQNVKSETFDSLIALSRQEVDELLDLAFGGRITAEELEPDRFGLLVADDTYYFGLGDPESAKIKGSVSGSLEGRNPEVLYAYQSQDESGNPADYRLTVRFMPSHKNTFGYSVESFAVDDEKPARDAMWAAVKEMTGPLNALLNNLYQYGWSYPDGEVTPAYATAYLYKLVNDTYSGLAEHYEGIGNGDDQAVAFEGTEIDNLLDMAFHDKFSKEQLDFESGSVVLRDGVYYVLMGDPEGSEIRNPVTGTLTENGAEAEYEYAVSQNDETESLHILTAVLANCDSNNTGYTVTGFSVDDPALEAPAKP